MSVVTSQQQDEEYDDIDEQEYQRMNEILQQMVADNEFIARENAMLQSFLAKIDTAKVDAMAEEDAAKKKKSTKKGRSEAKKDMFHKLTDEEKCDIVGQEIELVQEEITTIRQAGEKDSDDIQTLMDEIDMRISETKKDTYEFKRDIIIAGENPRSGKIMGEKMVRFMEEKLRQKDVTIEKLRLKNTTTKAYILKLEQQLAHKEEMGEVLHLVDFDQLKIENQQYMDKIEEKNTELLKLKTSTNRTVQILNHLKSSLSECLDRKSQLQKSIALSKAELERFTSEAGHVEVEKEKAFRTLRALKFEQEDIDQPHIKDYITIKHEVTELEAKVDDWKRKIDILNMEEKRTRALLKTVSGVGGGVLGTPQ